VPDTFISYRRDDSAGYAGRLREALERRLGRGRVFRDVDALQPGDDFVRAIDQRIQECRAFLAVIGQQWLEARDPQGTVRLAQPDDHVRLEIASALARGDLLVVPVLVEGAAMPAAADLPESIRPLASRHAIALRDDTWDADVDRLAAAIELVARPPASGARPRAVRWPRRLRRSALAAVAALAVLALVLTVWLQWGGMPLATGSGVPEEGAGYAIGLPEVAELAHGRVVYGVREGRVEPRGQAAELQLRLRVGNEGRGDIAISERSFRLGVGDEVRPPARDVSAYVRGSSTRDLDVAFEVPAGATRARLRIADGNAAAELSLDLSPARRGWGTGSRPPSPVTAALPRQPARLIADDALEVTLERVTIRRFANLVRMTCAVGATNRGRGLRSLGDLQLRVLTGDASIAPLEAQHILIEPAANAAATYDFDVPPERRRVVLRATLGDRSAEVPLEIP
jgi:hypothetical protein